jgi:hypothetical protein
MRVMVFLQASVLGWTKTAFTTREIIAHALAISTRR